MSDISPELISIRRTDNSCILDYCRSICVQRDTSVIVLERACLMLLATLSWDLAKHKAGQYLYSRYSQQSCRGRARGREGQSSEGRAGPVEEGTVW